MCISVRFFTYFKIHLFQVIVPKTNVEARQNNLLDFDCRSGKGFPFMRDNSAKLDLYLDNISVQILNYCIPQQKIAFGEPIILFSVICCYETKNHCMCSYSCAFPQMQKK